MKIGRTRLFLKTDGKNIKSRKGPSRAIPLGKIKKNKERDPADPWVLLMHGLCLVTVRKKQAETERKKGPEGGEF